MTFSYATVCSGIEAVSLGFEPLGAQPVFFSEYSSEHPWPAHFLKVRYPTVPNLGDMLKMDGRAYRGKLDVLWGSTPCQSFSVAGLRKGIVDPRGNLSMKFIDLVDDIDPPVLCWENVPGVLTERKTNAFGCLLGGLAGEIQPLQPPGRDWADAGIVYGPRRVLAWRKFDSQHFGLAQQRERVVVVASPTESGIDPTRILFERRPLGVISLKRRGGWSPPIPGAPECVAAYGAAVRGRKDGQQIEIRDDLSNCLRASQGGSDKAMVLCWTGHEWRLRLLMPQEAELLMGMPEGYTAIPDASDSVRYHAIGNAVAVPMVKWIGLRIIDELCRASS